MDNSRQFSVNINVNANTSQAKNQFNTIFEQMKKDIGQTEVEFNKLQGILNSIEVPGKLKKGLEGLTSKIGDEIKNFKSLTENGLGDLDNSKKIEQSAQRISELYRKLGIEIKDFTGLDINKLLPQEFVKRVKTARENWKAFTDTFSTIDIKNKSIQETNEKLKEQEKIIQELENKQKNYTPGENEKLNLEGLKELIHMQDLLKQQREVSEARDKAAKNRDTTTLERQQEVKRLEQQYKTLGQQIEESKQKQQALVQAMNDNKNIGQNLENAKKEYESLQHTLETLKESARTEEIERFREALAKTLEMPNKNELPKTFEELELYIKNLDVEQAEKLTNLLKQLTPAAEAGAGAVKKLGESSKQASAGFRELTAREKEIEQLANRVKYFFSIGNTVMLFRRAIKSAINTVKELDEVMTQAAVVTKFSVADMWAQLPEYAKRANELGVTIKGVYEASTLYYQQGLETTQVIGVANETLKMAKIAGLDYATATNYMTSALRGFNMEVNELSAQKVNDIYSQLAAHTASNVEEISIAMSKVAPLAHNAGMEIETTAAMLAQMIEKTREAPETLGTAMKTVIARFQELKKDPALIEPIDGEMVDANKVETALNTIGVALRDTNGQFRQLDDVFLEISQKWDTLDVNTQRYIATIAAGSRQQSRFIAMMADYSRTTELVKMANNSAGASAEQFEKTQASLATALNRLKVAWNQFTMGLANNQIIKIVINLISGFINNINKLTNTLSLGSGLLKSFFNLGTLLVAIKLGKAAFTGFFNWLLKDSVIRGTAAGTATGTGFGAGLNKTLLSTQKLFSGKTWIGPSLMSARVEVEKLTLAEAKGTASTEALNAAQAKYNLLLKDSIAGMALSNEQQIVANELIALDIDETIANAAALSGLTKTEVDEIITRGIQNHETEETIAKNLEAAAATKIEEGAEKGLIKTQRMGILTRARYILQLLFGTKAARADAIAKLGLAKADAAATKSQWSLNAAMAACPIGYIIAGIAAITAAIVVINKLIKKNSLANRMKEAAEETKKAREAAEKVKEVYDELIGDKSNYDEVQKSLSKITYGTLEWKQALIDANQQVLELIQKYSYLSQFVGKGEYGQLIIKEEGWNELQQWQETGYRTALGIQTITSVNEAQLKKEAYDNAFRGISWLYGKETEAENFANTLREYASNGKIVTFEDVFKSGELADELISFFNLENILTNEDGTHRYYSVDTKELDREKVETGLKAAYDYIEGTESITLEIAKKYAAGLEATLPEEVKNNLSDSADLVIEYYAQQFSNVDPDSLPELDLSTFKDQYASEIEKTGGVITGNDLSSLQVAYAALTSTSLDIVKETFTNKKELEEMIRKGLKANEFSKEIEDFSESFTLLGDEAKKALTVTMSGGRGYRKGEGESQNLESLWNSNEAYRIVYKSFDDFANAYELAIANGQRIIEDKIKILDEKKGIKLPDNFLNGFEAQAIDSLTDNLLEVFKKSGSSAASETASMIQEVIDKVAEEDQDKFIAALNGINWKDVTSIQNLNNIVNNLGLKGKFTTKELDRLEKQIISTAKATQQIDLEKLKDEVNSLAKIQYNLKKTKENSFSEEDYKTLIEAGVANAGDFVYNLATDSWNYIGNEMSVLSAALSENTEALLGIDILESQVKSSAVAKDLVDKNPNLNMSDQDALKDFIYSYISESDSNNQVVSLEALEEAYHNFDIFALQDYAKAIIAEANAYSTRKTNLDTINFQNASVKAQSENSIMQNANRAMISSGEMNEYATALFAQAQALGINEELLNNFYNALNSGKDILASYYLQQIGYIASIQEEANAWELNKEELDNYAKALLKTNKAEADSLDKAYKLAIANKRLEKGYKDLADNGEDWYATLSKAKNDEDKASSEYLDASQNYRKAVQNIINSDDELSEDWLNNNIENLNKAIQGDNSAIEDIIISAIVDTSGINESIPEIEDAIATVINDPALKDIEIGATLNIDEAPALKALADIMIAAGYSTSQIQEAFNDLGWEAEPIFYYEYDPNTGFETPILVGIKTVEKKTPGVGDLNKYISTRGSGSGGGSSDKESEWENPYDKLYNITKQINGELRIREQLEKRYQRLLNTHAETGKLLKENIDQQIASLEKQNKLQEEIRDGRLKQIKELEAENSDLLQYARFDETIGVGGEIQIDWDLINDVDKANDEELGKRIEDYISKMEEWADSRHEAIDAIEDNTDAIIELQQTGKEEYKDLEDRALEAIIGHQQRLIDEQEKINNSINEANEALTDAISKNIEKIRQDRQNQETETSLAEKERRLAYLRQDTTGSNAVEIKKLEKDLEKERQNYTDSLIDQSLNDLKEQNDAAAKQREKQIELMQSQLKWQEDTGYYVNQATDMVRKAIEKGIIDETSPLYGLLREQEGLYTKSNASRQEWKEDLTAAIAKAYVYQQSTLNGENIMAGMQQAVENGDYATLGVLESQRNAKIRSQGLQNEWPETDMYENYLKGIRQYQNDPDKFADYMAELNKAANEGRWDEVFQFAGMRDAKIANGGTGYKERESLLIAFNKWYNAGQQWNRYATGGLADYTGPAWLDGTKSRPEMVLNARDTQNFLELRDILSSMAASGTGNSSVGNFYCDIDINVGEISNDYDVDRIAARIKQSIYEDSTYRNVNAINFLK